MLTDREIQHNNLIKSLKESVDILSERLENFKIEKDNTKSKIDLSRRFSMVNLPSAGLYYPNKKGSLLVKYLTSVEENILCDYMLMESGLGIKFVLNSVLMDDIDIESLLLSDFQAILIFLRANAFGDSVNVEPVCPHCGKINETSFKLSSLEFKEPKYKPNEKGEYIIKIDGSNLEIVISPMTLKKELEKNSNEKETDFFTFKDENGFDLKIKKERTLNLIYNIDSINGVKDKEKIKNVIRKLPKKNVDAIIEFIEENEIGVNEKINLNCMFCQQEFIQRVNIGYNFLTMREEHATKIEEDL